MKVDGTPMVASGRGRRGTGVCRAVASFEKTSPRLSNSATPAAILPENVVKVFVRLLWLCPDEACFWLRWDQPTSLPALNEWSAFHICGPASAIAGGRWLEERHPPFRIFISSQDLLIGTRKIIVSHLKKQMRRCQRLNGGANAPWSPVLPQLSPGTGTEAGAGDNSCVTWIRQRCRRQHLSNGAVISRLDRENGTLHIACCTPQRGTRTDWLRADRSLRPLGQAKR